MATWRVQFIDSTNDAIGLFTASDVESLEDALQEVIDMASIPDGTVQMVIELDTVAA